MGLHGPGFPDAVTSLRLSTSACTLHHWLWTPHVTVYGKRVNCACKSRCSSWWWQVIAWPLVHFCDHWLRTMVSRRLMGPSSPFARVRMPSGTARFSQTPVVPSYPTRASSPMSHRADLGPSNPVQSTRHQFSVGPGRAATRSPSAGPRTPYPTTPHSAKFHTIAQGNWQAQPATGRVAAAVAEPGLCRY